MSLFRSRREKTLKAKAVQLYGTAMAQARHPAFYADLGVEDTPDGRLAMISLHVLLVLDRLSDNAEALALSAADSSSRTTHRGPSDSQTPAQRLGRTLMEVFVEDLDQAMRELGIGDMGVPKRVKQAIAQFYALARAFKAAHCEREQSQVLPDQLLDMCPGLGGTQNHVATLVDYLEVSRRHLQQVSQKDIEAGRITFPLMDEVARDWANYVLPAS